MSTSPILTIGLRTTIVAALALNAVMQPAMAATAHPPPSASAPTPEEPVTVAQSDRMPWNAVVVDARGRFIVGSPKWPGNSGPTVAIVGKNGQLRPYPDAKWNSWTPAVDATHAFVSVNAIHDRLR